jgi:ubiquinol-cytochrome c reductase cytochrome b subunit
MWGKIKDWLEIRTGINELIKSRFKEYRMPGNVNIFYTLGFVILTGLAVQAVTGIILLLYYIPHYEHAFKSVQDIMNKVPYGWLFRQMHVVSGSLIVVAVLLHMLSVFFMGSYKKPREITWVVGVLMLFLTLMLCLTGYLLPWSQPAYWGTTIVTAIPSAFPFVGDFITEIIRGDKQVTGITLNRFFALHVSLLPAIFIVLIASHIFLIIRTGFSAPPSGITGEEIKAWTEYRHETHPNGYPFYPNFLLRAALMVTMYFAAVFFIITFAPMLLLGEGANIAADPSRTPANIRPPWYFLAPYQFLKLIPNKFIGISLELIILCLILLWPLFDTKRERNILKRPYLLSVFLFSSVLWVVLTIWGRY